MAKKKKKQPTSLTSRIDLRLSPAEKKQYEDAAARQGIGVSLWLRLAARRVVAEHGGKVQLVDFGERKG